MVEPRRRAQQKITRAIRPSMRLRIGHCLNSVEQRGRSAQDTGNSAHRQRTQFVSDGPMNKLLLSMLPKDSTPHFQLEYMALTQCEDQYQACDKSHHTYQQQIHPTIYWCHKR